MSNAIAVLYLEELKATMRGRFSWLGAAVILFVVGGIAGLVALSVPGARGSDELPFGPFMIGGFWVAVAAAG